MPQLPASPEPAEPALCLECGAIETDVLRGCPACGSRRLARHPEIRSLAIAHLDCDAFYAAIEKRDNPDLEYLPVIVGGGVRGVVTTACYIARTYGIRSAMPMFKARDACPHAVVVKPDFRKYREAAGQIRKLMLELTPAIQPISIDEAFLDLTGTERLHGAPPAAQLARIAQRIKKDVGITVSVGLSHNKFLAKIASDLDKPEGFSVIGREETLRFLADKPISVIWGVGAVTSRKLQRDGLVSIGQLQQMDERELAKRYGALGQRLARLARGEDSRPVRADSRAKSISSETTFSTDLSDYGDLSRSLWDRCEDVSRRAKEAGLGGYTVTLRLKSARFETITRRRSLEHPTQLADMIFDVADALLKVEATGRAFRLIGVGVSDLAGEAACDPPNLFDPARARNAEAERAIDSVRAKFGAASIFKGRGLRSR